MLESLPALAETFGPVYSLSGNGADTRERPFLDVRPTLERSIHMKQVLTAVLILALSGSSVLAQHAEEKTTSQKETSSAVKKHPIDLQEEWAAAEQKGDKEFLSEWLPLHRSQREG
jgi:hypothetical protein